MKIEVIDTIWKDIVFMKDFKTDKIFGFVRKRPAICAQGKNIDEVKTKIEKIIDKIKK